MANKKTLFWVLWIFVPIIILFIFGITSDALLALNTICLLALSAVYLVIILWYIHKNLLHVVRKSKYFYFLIAGILALVVFLLLPFRYAKVKEDNYYINNMIQNEDVIIDVMKDKNQYSKGNDIVFTKFVINNNGNAMDNLILPPGWNRGSDFIISKDGIGDTLDIHYGKGNFFDIYMRTSKSGGMVRVRLGQNQAVYDLYSPDEGKSIKMDIGRLLVHPEISDKPSVARYLFYLSEYGILYIITLGVCIFTSTRNKKLRKTKAVLDK